MDICHVHKHTHKKKELGQYPAILTSCLWSITHICSLFVFVAYNACSDWLIPGHHSLLSPWDDYSPAKAKQKAI